MAFNQKAVSSTYNENVLEKLLCHRTFALSMTHDARVTRVIMSQAFELVEFNSCQAFIHLHSFGVMKTPPQKYE